MFFDRTAPIVHFRSASKTCIVFDCGNSASGISRCGAAPVAAAAATAPFVATISGL